ncbi:MAG: DNA alkylation repair protein [Patescibacteria group bacterium]|nr:DNA alkylation repair protein [Patescibacteria group bacterium]
MIKITLIYSPILAKKLSELSSESKASILSRFFKTGPGEYGAGDKFLGISMPSLHLLVKASSELSDKALEELLKSPYHEIRMLGALFMAKRYQQAKSKKEQSAAVNYYLAHYGALNNWDLVDVTVSKVWGAYLINHPKKRNKLYIWARSKNMWQRRMAMVACAALIRANDLSDALALSKLLLSDKEDLMHKAVGWMLREIGKKDKVALVKFINDYGFKMPRTTLRYAIEHFSKVGRKKFLQIKYQG